MHSCREHIEESLDIYLDEFEEMPIMDGINNPSLKCHVCQKVADYQLGKSGVKASWE